MKTLLLVEDENIIALSQSMILKNHGYMVIRSKTGEDAVEAIRKDDSIDLVLMDIDLGKGIDGTEAAKQILGFRSIPIVFLTGHREQEMVEKVRGITRYGYVLKNSGAFVLIEAIAMAFELFETNIKLQEQMERLAEREANLAAAFNNTLQLFILVDRDFRIMELNAVARQYYLEILKKEVAPGMSILELIHPPQLEDFRNNFMKTLQGETCTVVKELPAKERTLYFQFCYSPVISSDGTVASVVFTVLDITKTMEAEQKVRLQSKVLEDIDRSIVVTRPNGEIILWNKGAELLSGWRSEEVIGKDVVEFLPSDVTREQADEISQKLSAGEKWSGCFTLKNRNGRNFNAYVVNKPIIEDGSLTAILGVISNPKAN